MCGIAGRIQTSRARQLIDARLALSLVRALHHRGPDEWGYYQSPQQDVLLCSVRLAIIGLDNGKQPIPDAKKEIWVTFNGEIYNHRALRRELESVGYRFRTQTDTEVLVHLYHQHGIQMVRRLRGEFAFCLYDSRARKAYLVRDRFGIKPLHYHRFPDGLAFGSEAKALFVQPGITPRFDREVIVSLMQGFLWSDDSIFEGVSQVPAASFLVFDQDKNQHRIERYWHHPLQSVPASVSADREEELVRGFHQRFEEAVRIRLQADVPVGAYLSGGLDSCATVATAVACGVRPVTFTVAFEDQQFAEQAYAESLNSSLGLEGNQVVIGQGDLRDAFARSVWHSELPVVNPHGAAKLRLSALARGRRKVVITGEGADEVLLGYRCFEHQLRMQQSPGDRAQLKRFVREHPRDVVATHKLPHFEEVEARLGNYPYPLVRHFAVRPRARKLLSGGFQEVFDSFCWQEQIESRLDLERLRSLESIEASQYLLFETDLPGYLLNYLGDRQEMANGIEGRLPFLDHPLVEFCGTLPRPLKLRLAAEHAQSKVILRQAMREVLPEALRVRAKQPFYAPSSDSLQLTDPRGPWREHLTTSAYASCGVFSHTRGSWLRRLCRLTRKHHMNFALEGALVLILSTHLLHRLYVQDFQASLDRYSSCVIPEDALAPNDCDRIYASLPS